MVIPKILNWNDRFALIDRFKPTDTEVSRIFGVSNQEFAVAKNLRSNGTFIATKNIDYNSYAPAFTLTTRPIIRPMTDKSTVTSIKLPETATRIQKKRGRKGSNITTAFSKVPNTPVDVEQFATANKVSIAVLRQSKRFDSQPETGIIRVKKDKQTGSLMIWREKTEG